MIMMPDGLKSYFHACYRGRYIPLPKLEILYTTTHQQINSPWGYVLEEGYSGFEVLEKSNQDSDTGLVGILFKPPGVPDSS